MIIFSKSELDRLQRDMPDLEKELDQRSGLLAQQIMSGIASSVDASVMAERINNECKKALLASLLVGLAYGRRQASGAPAHGSPP